ncbi:Unconventional prefoldin RPB5 interactor [Taenia crassiceps]|uniref:Unconventional prefoldin RPB5 interactor n=1 Tax=Taenia crassiceps TaxID=6207 RepID=A0ABR4QRC1_9CEST
MLTLVATSQGQPLLFAEFVYRFAWSCASGLFANVNVGSDPSGAAHRFFLIFMERFDRLLEEQRKAIWQTNDKIGKLETYADEYTHLKTRLEEISKCFSKRAIIPLSPRALIPACLIHTNEVLVYLGGSAEHFCEASTSQSITIINKRIERIQQEVQQLQEQKRLLTDRASYTQRLVKGERPQSVSGEGDGGIEFEIREEFNPEREKEWQAKHKERVQAERTQERIEAHVIPFSTPKVGIQDESPSDDTSHVSPDITTCGSSNPAPPVNSNIRDWHRASPADVVAFVQRRCRGAEPMNIPKPTQSHHLLATHKPHGKSGSEVELATQPSKRPIEPFSQIVERGPASIDGVDRIRSGDGPVSRFRARRNRNL